MKILNVVSDALRNAKYGIISEFDRFTSNLSRTWDYAKFGWNCPDWDNSYLYAEIGFKLKRIQKSLIDGVSDLTYSDMPFAMEALQEAIDICDRLYDNDYILITDSYEAEQELIKIDLSKLGYILTQWSEYWWD